MAFSEILNSIRELERVEARATFCRGNMCLVYYNASHGICTHYTDGHFQIHCSCLSFAHHWQASPCIHICQLGNESAVQLQNNNYLPCYPPHAFPDNLGRSYLPPAPHLR